jgi:hypothetical protein
MTTAVHHLNCGTNHRLRMDNLERVRELRSAHQGDVDVFCAHAAADFDRFRPVVEQGALPAG